MNRFQIPTNPVHYVDSGSDVNSATDYRVNVSAPGSSGTPTIDLHEDIWYRENNGSLPQAVCFAGIGCSAGVSTKQQLYLSRPLSPITNGRIPVFSVEQLSDNSYVGTLSILGSTNAAGTTSIQIEKSAFNPTRAINFSIMSGNWGNGTGKNVQETALATLTPIGPVLNYTVTATASPKIPSIQITPQIWKKATAGDTLVYTGPVVTCSLAAQCIASGNFTPPDAATYYTNAIVLYTLPATTADDMTVETRQNVIAAASAGGSVSCNAPPYGAYFDFTINTVKLDCKSDWQPAVCYDNALIRWAKAGKSSSLKSNLTNDLWKENSACTASYSFAVDPPANKPVYVVAVNNNDMTVSFHHAIDAELLDTSLKPEDTTWANWKFFQYTNLDIKAGDWQLPKGGPSFETKVEIKEFTGITCGYWTSERVKKTFYIDQSGQVSTNPDILPHPGYIVVQSGKTLINNRDIPIELQNVIKSVDRSDGFTLNKWELNPTDHKITFYVFDVRDEKALADFEGENIGQYSVQIIQDTKFEEIRKSVSQQLINYLNDPDYQIAHIGMSTNRMSDPPENNAELWAYKSTTENMKLDNLVINGWTIKVYPVSG
jgi:hypothetical protein